MFDFKPGDRVRVIGETKVGEIVSLIEDVALVQYPKGNKRKITLVNLLPPLDDNSIRLTPETYDEAVKSIMYDIAADIGDTDQLDGVLEIVGAVSSQLKTRLFNKND